MICSDLTAEEEAKQADTPKRIILFVTIPTKVGSNGKPMDPSHYFWRDDMQRFFTPELLIALRKPNEKLESRIVNSLVSALIINSLQIKGFEDKKIFAFDSMWFQEIVKKNNKSPYIPITDFSLWEPRKFKDLSKYDELIWPVCSDDHWYDILKSNKHLH